MYRGTTFQIIKTSNITDNLANMSNKINPIPTTPLLYTHLPNIHNCMLCKNVLAFSQNFLHMSNFYNQLI
jgi:hypothetical protein